jgi:hypothetical protein
MNATEWTAIGSIATAAAALIAVGAILVPLYVTRRRNNSERAARLRDAVTTFAESTQRLTASFENGSSFALVAAAITDYIRQQLPESATMDDAWQFLGDPRNGLRAALVGLANASASAATPELEAMQITAHDFVGELDLLSSAGQMFFRTVEGGTRAVFVRLLESVPVELLKQKDKSTSVHELLWNLASSLHSNSALIFVSQGFGVLQELNSIIGTVAAAQRRLDTAQLLRAARSKGAMEPPDDLLPRISLLEKRGVLKAHEAMTLTASVSKIQVLLTTESALKRAAEATSAGSS